MDAGAPRPRARRWPVALLGVAVLGTILFSEWRRGRLAPVPLPAAPAPAGESARSAGIPAAPASAPATLPSVASRSDERLIALRARLAMSSLRGTAPDGVLHLDASGQVILDAGLRRVFDYWLTLDGEFSEDDVRTLMHADLADRHGAAVAAQVLTAFERYLGLRAQLAAAPPSGVPAERLRQVQAARRTWFGTDADALFGAEEAQIAHTLERQRIENSELGEAEREAQLAALEARRPAAERDAERDATAAHLAAEQTRQLDNDEVSAATRHAEREALWGRDAAHRLAALDAQRAQWAARVAAFARERERLLADPGRDPAARDQAIAALMQRDFDEAERARIEALVRTGTLPPGG